MTILLNDQDQATHLKELRQLAQMGTKALQGLPLSLDFFDKLIGQITARMNGWSRVDCDISVFLDMTEECETHGRYLANKYGVCPGCEATGDEEPDALEADAAPALTVTLAAPRGPLLYGMDDGFGNVYEGPDLPAVPDPEPERDEFPHDTADRDYREGYDR